MEEKKCMCGAVLTKMDTGCLRCLICKPIVDPPAPKPADDSKRVDVPWTEDRIRAIVKDEMQNWHKMTTVHTEKLDLKLTEVATDRPDVHVIDDQKVTVAGGGEVPKDVEIPLAPPKWTDQAESLGISWRGRKKETVLDEIEKALEVPTGG